MKTMNLDSKVIGKKQKKIEPKNTPPDQSSQTLSKKPKVSLLKRISTWFMSKNTIQQMLIAGTACLIILGVGGIGIYYLLLAEGQAEELNIEHLISARTSGVPSYSSTIGLTLPNAPRDTENPINGLLFTKNEYKEFSEKYPIAVMIENHLDARPQSGYNSADIVFETLVEGGITRTMAIFWSRDAEEIGPLRSARQYFLEWLSPYDPLYMHIGQAYSDDPRVDAAGNIYAYGIKSMDRYGTFWRSSERVAPHNAYTSSELLYEKAEVYGYTDSPRDITRWSFKTDALPDQRGSGTDVTLVFFERLYNNGIYDVTWKYDNERNVYERYNGSTPYTDANTDETVYAKNVIIQRVETISTYDYKAHMIVTTIDEGDAIILRDGQVIDATWKKTSREARTMFYDLEGNEIQFNRGNIWVEAVPIDQGTVQTD